MIGVRNFVPCEKRTERLVGKRGKESAASRYALATPPDGFSIQEDKPYAEVSSVAISPGTSGSN